MRDFLIRVVINAVAVAIAAYLIPGIHVTNDLVPLLLVGLILTLVNALIKPILMLLSCPFVLLTLGLFVLVVNGFVLQIADYFSGGALQVDSLWSAVLGGIVMAIVNMVLEGLLGEKPAEAPRKRDG
jgi:putative membrane protein